MLAKLAAPGAT
ncbi:13E12 repeat family protein, partial [Mycobacterium tuberculosis TB_RSA71]